MALDPIQSLIERWSAASAPERANSQLFLAELCEALGVARPEPTFHNGYAFEFPVPQHHRDGSVTDGRAKIYLVAGWAGTGGNSGPLPVTCSSNA